MLMCQFNLKKRFKGEEIPIALEPGDVTSSNTLSLIIGVKDSDDGYTILMNVREWNELKKQVDDLITG